MESEPEAAGTLYIDGHVRVYHGGLTELPKRHVSRERSVYEASLITGLMMGQVVPSLWSKKQLIQAC
jgi:hypothetical protein